MFMCWPTATQSIKDRTATLFLIWRPSGFNVRSITALPIICWRWRTESMEISFINSPKPLSANNGGRRRRPSTSATSTTATPTRTSMESPTTRMRSGSAFTRRPAKTCPAKWVSSPASASVHPSGRDFGFLYRAATFCCSAIGPSHISSCSSTFWSPSSSASTSATRVWMPAKVFPTSASCSSTLFTSGETFLSKIWGTFHQKIFSGTQRWCRVCCASPPKFRYLRKKSSTIGTSFGRITSPR